VIRAFIIFSITAVLPACSPLLAERLGEEPRALPVFPQQDMAKAQDDNGGGLWHMNGH